MPVYKYENGVVNYMDIQSAKSLTMDATDNLTKTDKIVLVKVIGPQGGEHGKIRISLSNLKKMISNL